MNEQIDFIHGLLAADYEEQAKKQGYTLGDYKKLFARVKDGYMVLRMRGYFTDAQYESLLKKVQKDLVRNLKPLRKDKQNGTR